jgi:hypothetical protein
VNSYRADALLVSVLLLSWQVWCADPPPEFTAAGVVRGDSSAKILAPGVGMSIYGQHLAPSNGGCPSSADPQRRETPNPWRPDQRFADTSIYPTELCGVQVFIGDKPAGLLYVSEKTINFKIPQDAPESGRVAIRVVRMGQSSAPVTMEAGFEKTVISLEQPAYTGMPVWLKVELPFGLGSIRYPYSMGPAGFGCNEVEVRKQGKLLALQPGSAQHFGGSSSGNICGSYGAARASNRIGRLPLHLLYRFDAPGTYEVRLTVWNRPVGFGPQSQLRARSEWTPIEVLPSKPNQRAEWLAALRAHSPVEAAELLTETLPSLLGLPDDVSLDLLADYLYDPDASVRSYAARGLSYWPEEAAPEKLLGLLHTKGPSNSLIGFVMQQPDFRVAHSDEVVEASLPFLAADSPVLVAGAVSALRLASLANPAIREALLQSAEHVVVRADSQTGSDLAQTIAATKDERAHAVLRSLLDKGYKQVAHALLSFRDPADLPSLSALLPGSGGAISPEELYRSYGDAAVPYLERALSGAPERFMAESIARQLMAIGDAAGFRFAAQSIEQKGVSRFDMIQALKSQFPELKTANDDTIAAFDKKLAGSAK